MDDASLPLRAARRRYFDENGFDPDGGYSARWVKVKLGPVPFAFPNSAARVRAVRYHDLHHLVTSYATDIVGEAEIGAWEVASSCRGFFAAWLLNLLVMPMGAVLEPKAIYRAFIRGRHTRNLYGTTLDDALLDASVGSVRARLGLDRNDFAATPRDQLAFGGWCLVSAGLHLSMAALIFGPIALAIAQAC